MGTRARGTGRWLFVLVSFASTGFAQSEPEQPAQDTASQRPAAQPPTSSPSASESNAEPTYAPLPHRQPAKQASDDALEVPPTLAPLAPDTRPPNAAAGQPLPSAPPSAVYFGGRGQWVMMGSANGLNLSRAAYSGSSASDSSASVGLGIDYFVVDGVSLGIAADARYRDTKGYGATTFSESRSTLFSGGIRFGANARLGESISWYPRLTLMLTSSHATITPLATSNGEAPGQAVTQSRVGPAMSLYAPLLLHPASHFVIGLGPNIYHDFAVTRGGPYDGSQSTVVGADFTVGGWWGGEASDREADDGADSAGELKPAKSAELFGGPGQIVLTSLTDATIGHQTYSNSKGSETYVTIEPGIDYFVTERASIGSSLVIAHSGGTGLDSSGTSTEFRSMSFGLELGAGYNLRLSAVASIWLRGSVGFGSVDSSVSSARGTNQHTRTRGWVNVSAPFLVHPATHFFVGAGPFLFHELSDRDQYDYENKATRYGLSLVLGGWFGGPRGLATLVPPGT